MKKRKSNLELLRIIAMFLIVLGHVTWQTDYSYKISENFLSVLLTQMLWIGGPLGVTIFTLISSYFLSFSSFKNGRVKKIILTTDLYSWCILVIILITSGIHLLNLKIIVESIFPVITGGYWYISAYVGVLLISPFLNKLINTLNYNEYIRLVILLIILTSILPVFLKNQTYSISGISFYNLVTIYFIGGFVRKFNNKFTSKHNLLYYSIIIISFLALTTSIFVIDIVKGKNGFGNDTRIWGMYLGSYTPSVFSILMGTCIFIIFKNMHVRYNKVINKIASSTLAVYLIHTQPAFIDILWNKIFHLADFEYTPYVFIIEIGVAILIFIVCVLIDKIMNTFIRVIGKAF